MRSAQPTAYDQKTQMVNALGDGLCSLLSQLAYASSHPLPQLQLAQELAHPPQLLAGVTAWG